MSNSLVGALKNPELQKHELNEIDEDQRRAGVVAGSQEIMDGASHLQDSPSPLFVSEHSPVSTISVTYEALHPEVIGRDAVQVVVPSVQRRWEYRPYQEEAFISKVIKEYDDSEELQFLVKYSDGNEEEVSGV